MESDQETTQENVIEHPKHYTYSKIECIEVIEAWGLGFHLGSCLKYFCRAGKKDPSKEVEDLKKAAWYLERWIETLEAKQEKRPTIKPDLMRT